MDVHCRFGVEVCLNRSHAQPSFMCLRQRLIRALEAFGRNSKIRTLIFSIMHRFSSSYPENRAGSWITEDCSLAAENLMLAAFAERLGTCWIGFAQSYLNTAEGRTALGIPGA